MRAGARVPLEPSLLVHPIHPARTNSSTPVLAISLSPSTMSSNGPTPPTGAGSYETMFEHMTVQEAFDDLASRHVLSMPDPQLVDMVRVCFQIEQA